MALVCDLNRTNARASFDLADPYARWSAKYDAGGLFLGRKADAAPGWDPSRGAEGALDELERIARKKDDLWMLGALELHRSSCTTPEAALRFMAMAVVTALANPKQITRENIQIREENEAKKRLARKQERQRTARDEHKLRQQEQRIREATAGLVTRVLAAPVEEARRVEEDAKKATAARLAPTIALNKRLVRDKMLRVDRERRQRARVA